MFGLLGTGDVLAPPAFEKRVWTHDVRISSVSQAPACVHYQHPFSSELAGPLALCGRSDSDLGLLTARLSLLCLGSLAIAPHLVSGDRSLTDALLAGAILCPLMTK